jgi:hypothetical protein
VGEAQKLGANPRDKKKGDALVKEIGNLRRPKDQPKQPLKVHPSSNEKQLVFGSCCSCLDHQFLPTSTRSEFLV